MPLAGASAPATHEIAKLETDALKTNPPTNPIAQPEPQSVSAPAPETEVLSKVTAAVMPATARVSEPPEQAATAKADPKKSNKGILLAAAASALVALTLAGWFWMKRSNASMTMENAPLASSSPVESPNAAAALPSPATDASPSSAIAEPSPANQAVANAKPTASVKPGSKTNVSGALTPPANVQATSAQSNSYETATVAATPVKTEPEKVAPVESPAALIEQGNRLAAAGQLPQAIQLYEKARRANPGNADVYYLLGSAYHRSGDLANALESYRKCTSGSYASVAANHVKNLEKKLNKGK